MLARCSYNPWYRSEAPLQPVVVLTPSGNRMAPISAYHAAASPTISNSSSSSELGYVERRYPLTGEPPSARSVRYDLADPLLRSWFRFVFPNTSYIRHMGVVRALRDLIRPHLDDYFGLCFERLCREALPWLYRSEGVTAPSRLGSIGRNRCRSTLWVCAKMAG